MLVRNSQQTTLNNRSINGVSLRSKEKPVKSEKISKLQTAMFISLWFCVLLRCSLPIVIGCVHNWPVRIKSRCLWFYFRIHVVVQKNDSLMIFCYETGHWCWRIQTILLQQILIHEKANKSTFTWICVLQTLQPIEHTMCRSRTITSENFANKISLATHFMTAILEPFNENGSNCRKKLNQLKNLQVS